MILKNHKGFKQKYIQIHLGLGKTIKLLGQVVATPSNIATDYSSIT